MTTNYSYTGAPQTYTVPIGITSINIKAWGGGGSGGKYTFLNSSGGNAAMLEGNLAVTPGEVLTIDVAGGGILPTGGYVGGGNGNGDVASTGAGGGGCTIIKRGITNLVMVGGGGGAGNDTNGGYGGITNGQNGSSTNPGGCGFGGTQSSGGAGGDGGGIMSNGSPGGAGTGGNASTGNGYAAGGGSGYWGGGGGTGNKAGAGYWGAGGGGSSLYTNLTSFVGYAWDGDSTHQFANIPNYGQPAGTGVGGVSSTTGITAGGNGYVIISENSGVCFRETTRVLMSDGTFKAIKDIQRGDEILTDKKTGATKKVARTLKYMATGKATEIPMHLIGNRRNIVCSSTHPFWVSDTRRILAGDIEGTEIIEICEWLYTIQFEDEATYYVEGVKVDAVSPDHRKFKLPKELYFDETKYKANRVMKSEDDERRKKPNMTKHL